MLGLGNSPNVGYGAQSINTTYNEISDPTKPTASRKIADDDAAAAIIRNPLRAEIADARHNGRGDNATISRAQTIGDTQAAEPTNDI